MDLRRLREETRPEHEATEAQMPLMSSRLRLDTYCRLLRRLLPLLTAWEHWALEHAPAALRDEMRTRQRSPLLLQDLRTLDEALQPGDVAPSPAFSAALDRLLPAAGDAPEDREAAFLGAFYVIEGSTLGGQYIAKHVEAHFGMAPGAGTAYFRGYGEQTGARWREVQATLTAVPERQSEVVIGAAKAVFRAFGEVLEGSGKEGADVSR